MSRAVVVSLGGRRELRLIRIDTEGPDGEVLDRRIMLAKGWQDDVTLEAPVLLIPAAHAAEIAAALGRLAP